MHEKNFNFFIAHGSIVQSKSPWDALLVDNLIVLKHTLLGKDDSIFLMT